MSGSTQPTPPVIIIHHPPQQDTRRTSKMPRKDSPQLSYKLAMISHNKLQQEAASKTPDLRRCIAHSTMLRQSMEKAQKDVNKRLKSFHFDEKEVSEDSTSTTRTEHEVSPIREHITTTVKAMIRRRSVGSKNEGNTLRRVEAHTDSTVSTNPDKRMIVRGRKYAAKLLPSRKLWPYSGPVLQAGIVV